MSLVPAVGARRGLPHAARSGPVSTTSASCTSCSAESRAGWPFRPAVLEPCGAPFIEAVHPVPQRLAVHATDPRGIGPAHPIQHRRKRQQTPTLVGVLGGRRKTPQLVGRKLRPHPSPLLPWHESSRAMESAQHREGNRQRVRTEGRWYKAAPRRFVQLTFR